ISETAFQKVKDISSFPCRKIQKVKIRGKENYITILEIFTDRFLKETEQKMLTADIFEKAMDFYTGRQFSEAVQLFEKVLKENPSDMTADFFLKRSQKLQKFKGTGTLSEEEIDIL
ncbi:MAG TPA: hypothetical protein PL048_20915, partial [Leptospiraceae bacterium]|nr:hypothetical protein [Leptospiraceae bacterium]